MSILEYIQLNHRRYTKLLKKYIISDEFDAEVENILEWDNTLSRSTATECAVEKYVDNLEHDY